MLHAAEINRCLLQSDLEGLRKVWAHVAPHLEQLEPDRALLAMHMARVEMKTIPKKLREWSLAFLHDNGVMKVDGVWVEGEMPKSIISEGVGISVKSSNPYVAGRIHRAMHDALLNSFAKGETEAPIHRERMLKARAKERFKLRIS